MENQKPQSNFTAEVDPIAFKAREAAPDLAGLEIEPLIQTRATRPGLAGGGLASLGLHGFLVLIYLASPWFFSDPGVLDSPGQGVIMVGLYEGYGDPLEDGGPAGSDPVATTTESPPEPEIKPEPEIPPDPPTPDPEAVRLEKPAAKPVVKTAPPKKKKQPEKKVTPGQVEGQTTKAAASGPGIGDGGAGQGPGKKGGGGGGGTVEGYRQSNYGYIQRRIQRRMSYPQQARRMGLTGTATISFTITQSGQAANIRVSRSSGHDSLDQAAVAAVAGASPFPPPPSPANITIPLNFKLK